MNNSKWLEQFDETSGKFRWFIDEYFKSMWDILIEARHNKDVDKMISTMNIIWYELPDNRFSIKENPKGWNEFLFLIED